MTSGDVISYIEIHTPHFLNFYILLTKGFQSENPLHYKNAWYACNKGTLYTLASAFTVAGRRARTFAASTLFCILQYCMKQMGYSSKTTLITLHFNK